MDTVKSKSTLQQEFDDDIDLLRKILILGSVAPFDVSDVKSVCVSNRAGRIAQGEYLAAVFEDTPGDYAYSDLQLNALPVNGSDVMFVPSLSNLIIKHAYNDIYVRVSPVRTVRGVYDFARSHGRSERKMLWVTMLNPAHPNSFLKELIEEIKY